MCTSVLCFSEPTPVHVAPQGDRHPLRLPREYEEPGSPFGPTPNVRMRSAFRRSLRAAPPSLPQNQARTAARRLEIQSRTTQGQNRSGQMPRRSRQRQSDRWLLAVAVSPEERSDSRARSRAPASTPREKRPMSPFCASASAWPNAARPGRWPPTRVASARRCCLLTGHCRSNSSSEYAPRSSTSCTPAASRPGSTSPTGPDWYRYWLRRVAESRGA